MTYPNPRNQKTTLSDKILIATLVLVILAMSLALNVLWIKFLSHL